MTTSLLRNFSTLTVAALVMVTSAVLAAPPANDNFANAQVYTGAFLTADTSMATAETGEPDAYYGAGNPSPIRSVWWKFTPTVSGFYQLETTGSTFDTVMSLYSGSSLATLVLMASNDDSLSFNTSLVVAYLAKGTTYRVQVDSYTSAFGTAKLAIKCLRYFPALTFQGSHVFTNVVYRTNEVGVFSCTLTNAGGVTGKMLLGGKSYPFSSAMGTAGTFSVNVARPGYVPVNLAVNSGSVSTTLSDGVPCTITNSLFVTATEGTSNNTYNAYPAGAGDGSLKALFPAVAPWSTTNPCPRAGRHNMSTTAIPNAGNSVASLTISTTGTCTGAGNLGDGTSFTFAVPLLNTNGVVSSIGNVGAFCFASSIYSSTGVFAGGGVFDGSINPSRFSGAAFWIRQPSKPGVALFPQGIYNGLTVYGSRYTAPPANTRIDAAFDPAGTCTFQAFSVTYPTFSQGATLSTLNKFSYSAPNANLVNLTLTTSSGTITGSAKFTGAPAASAVKAIFINHPGLGSNGFYGYVPGPTQYGSVTVQP
jgi:hypothetical protein